MILASHEDMTLLENRLMRISYRFAKDALDGKEGAKEAFESMQDITDMLGEDLNHGSKLLARAVKTILYMIDIIKNDNSENGTCEVPYTLPYAIMAIFNNL